MVQVNGCIDIDGDFDGVPTTSAGRARSPTRRPTRCSTRRRSCSPAPSPTGRTSADGVRGGHHPGTSPSDTAFGVDVLCQRHIANPSDPIPGTGLREPAAQLDVLSLLHHPSASGACWWQEGGPYLPGTTQRVRRQRATEFGPLQVVTYPASPFFTISKRYNDLRSLRAPIPVPRERVDTGSSSNSITGVLRQPRRRTPVLSIGRLAAAPARRRPGSYQPAAGGHRRRDPGCAWPGARCCAAPTGIR